MVDSFNGSEEPKEPRALLISLTIIPVVVKDITDSQNDTKKQIIRSDVDGRESQESFEAKIKKQISARKRTVFWIMT